MEAGLRRVLARARELGLLGDGPLSVHLDNAALFSEALPTPPSGRLRLLDLGSGGGVPGLVLAARRADLSVTLLDSQRRRCEFLRWGVEALDLGQRATVAEGRAEDLARETRLRGRFDVVTARSFGPPAATAECSAAFLAGTRSCLVVSEPPGPMDASRWPTDGLAGLGLVRGRRIEASGVGSVQVLEVLHPVDGSVPRRSGLPAKRPLF